MAGLLRLIALLAGVWVATAVPANAATGFADWSAVVVSGDAEGAEGGPTEAFDNARRDVASALIDAGFDRRNLRQFSVKPQAHADARPALAELNGIYDAMIELGARAPGGCLAYITSHGLPQGVLIGEDILPPAVLGAMLDESCGDRPTVVVVSACYSGVFVRPLARRNRMIMTAARADRTSFGCGEDDLYPYFDDCVLRALPSAPDFLALAPAVRGCVAAREKAEGMTPPSEPQVSVGAEARRWLSQHPFTDTPARRN